MEQAKDLLACNSYKESASSGNAVLKGAFIKWSRFVSESLIYERWTQRLSEVESVVNASIIL